MGALFKFKKFVVDQSDCAMKINTDAVLLGAIAIHPQPLRILDIGTGTGVIALMLAQRFEQAVIDAVEIDEPAALRAKQNFEDSPFRERMTLFKGSFVDHVLPQYYDLLVSNPPFFTGSLHNPDQRKKLARHTDLGFFQDLILYAQQVLRPQGILQLILPCELATQVIAMASSRDLQLVDQLRIKSFDQTAAFRTIISLQKDPLLHVDTLPTQQTFVLYTAKDVYSTGYNTLLKDFLLKL